MPFAQHLLRTQVFALNPVDTRASDPPREGHGEDEC